MQNGPLAGTGPPSREIAVPNRAKSLARFFHAKTLFSRETGLEPATSAVTGRRSNQLNYSRRETFTIGRNRTRTYDHLCVRQALYQLSYTPL